jgi:two-component system, LuxR family, sensor kinase FixL
MPRVDELTDSHELKHCIRDLVALSTLPAIWKDYNPRQIADSVAAALLSMLSADVVYVAAPGFRKEPLIEVTRVAAPFSASPADRVEAVLRQACQGGLDQTAVVDNPVAHGKLRIAAVPIGLGDSAAVAVGSADPGFPTDIQRLLLGIAANDATIALQRWYGEADQRRLMTLIERSAEFVSFASLDGRPHYLNPAGRDLIGLTDLEQASALNIFDFLAPEERFRAECQLMPSVLRSGRWIGELIFRNFRTKERIPLLVDWFRIDDPRTGRPMNMATISRDLREQKKMEMDLRRLNESLEQRVQERSSELEVAIRDLRTESARRERADSRARELQFELLHASRLSAAGQMAGALAHELNQPLTAFTNSVNAVRRLMANGVFQRPETARAILDEAADQALRAGEIIRRLRDSVTRGETEMQIEALPSMIQEASALASVGVGGLGAKVRLQFDPEAEAVLANRIQIQQVLLNLIRNALEAMEPSERKELDVITDRLDSDTVEVVVADRGPGLSGEMAAHVFEPFHTTKRDGMGLGLSICRSIVESHGGKLRHQPNPQGGSIFRFTLHAAPKIETSDVE